MSLEEKLVEEVFPGLHGEDKDKLIKGFTADGVDCKVKLEMIKENDINEYGLKKFSKQYVMKEVQKLKEKESPAGGGGGGVNVSHIDVKDGKGATIGVGGHARVENNYGEKKDESRPKTVNISGTSGTVNANDRDVNMNKQ